MRTFKVCNYLDATVAVIIPIQIISANVTALHPKAKMNVRFIANEK